MRKSGICSAFCITLFVLSCWNGCTTGLTVTLSAVLSSNVSSEVGFSHVQLTADVAAVRVWHIGLWMPLLMGSQLLMVDKFFSTNTAFKGILPFMALKKFHQMVISNNVIMKDTIIGRVIRKKYNKY